MHYYQEESIDSQMILHEQSIELTNQLAKIGDFFICGSERQKDFWMGVLTANGRVNPLNYLDDPSLRNLIDVVGIGYPDRDPTKEPIMRENPSHYSQRCPDRIMGWRRLELVKSPHVDKGLADSRRSPSRGTPNNTRDAPPKPGYS